MSEKVAPKIFRAALCFCLAAALGVGQVVAVTGDETAETGINHSTLVLSGCATKSVVRAEFGKVVSNLLNKALAEDSDYQEIEAEKNKKHPLRKLMAKTMGAFGEVVSINSSSTSKDGAKIVLDETDDWDEKDALVYRQQKTIDELHPKIAGALLQVAMGKGDPSAGDDSRVMVEKGMCELRQLVGGPVSELVDASMGRWASELENSPARDSQPTDLITTQKNLTMLTEAAVQDDPALLEIRKQLEHFARPNKLKDHAHNTVLTVLDTTAYMMPTAAIAAAVEAVKGLVVVSTGGCEEDKLQHLMFLTKRIASRSMALKEEIQLALYSRELGLRTKNKLLVKCADALIGNLVTPKTVNQVFLKMKADSESEAGTSSERKLSSRAGRFS